MSSQDTTDSLIIANVASNAAFQERCWLRFLIAAIAVANEEITSSVSAITAAGSGTLTFTVTPASITGLVVHNLSTPAVIPAGTTVASVTATTALLDHNVIGAGVAIGDNISFAVAYHAQRMRFAGALFSRSVDLMLLANLVLANSTNRTNCLADRLNVGGNILDSDIDFQVNSIFTGVAVARLL